MAIIKLVEELINKQIAYLESSNNFVVAVTARGNMFVKSKKSDIFMHIPGYKYNKEDSQAKKDFMERVQFMLNI